MGLAGGGHGHSACPLARLGRCGPRAARNSCASPRVQPRDLSKTRFTRVPCLVNVCVCVFLSEWFPFELNAIPAPQCYMQKTIQDLPKESFP